MKNCEPDRDDLLSKMARLGITTAIVRHQSTFDTGPIIANIKNTEGTFEITDGILTANDIVVGREDGGTTGAWRQSGGSVTVDSIALHGGSHELSGGSFDFNSRFDLTGTLNVNGGNAGQHGLIELYGIAGRWRRKPSTSASDEELERLAAFLADRGLL